MRVAFRADASVAMGTGHIMRCMTLANALRRRGITTRFVCRSLPAGLRTALAGGDHEVVELPAPSNIGQPDELPHSGWLGTSQAVDARDTAAALGDHEWDWVVVDHYALDVRWESALREVASSVLVIDDLADRDHDCDLLLDQNLHDAPAARYQARVPAGCRLLLGPRYALLREEFREARSRSEARTGSVRRILVAFGGMDAANVTGRAIEALRSLDSGGIAIDVLIGEHHPQRAGIGTACAEARFSLHVQTDRMAELMTAADLAVGAGGVSVWERACLGVPSLVLTVAGNQRTQVEAAALAGLVYAPECPTAPVPSEFIGRHIRALLENARLRQGMSQRGRTAVDGAGTDRVRRHLGGDVDVRPARPEDSARVFEWRNHPSIREVSGDAEAIERQTHERWFERVLHDPERSLLIGECDGTPIGVVRFDVAENTAEVSIYLVPGLAQPGSGSALLAAAEAWLRRARPHLGALEARVLRGNLPSHHLFLGAGYQVASTCYRKRLPHP